MCFGSKGVINKGVGRNSSILLCDDLDSTLCDLTGEKAFVPWQQRGGPAPAAQVKPQSKKPNFWFERMFVSEIRLGPSTALLVSSPSKGRWVVGLTEDLP